MRTICIDIYIYKTVLSLCVLYQFWSFQYTQKNSYLYSVFITYVISEHTGKTFPLKNTSLCYLHYVCIVYLSPSFPLFTILARSLPDFSYHEAKVRILNIAITWKWSTYSKKRKYFCLLKQKYWIELTRVMDMQLYLAIIYDHHFYLPYFVYV